MKTYQLTRAQQRIWYAQQKFKNSPLFNIGGTVIIDGNIDLCILKSAIGLFISNNDSLHIRYQDDNGSPVQYFSNEYANVEEKDFSHYDDPFKVFNHWVEKMFQIPFNLYDSDLFQFTVFTIRDGITGYYVKLHHSISDGWSVQLMLDQIKQNYEMIIKNSEIIPDKKQSYLDIITQEETWEESEEYQKSRAYWLDMYSPFPEIDSNLKKTSNISQRDVFPLTDKQESELLSYIKNTGITFNTFIIALYLLYEYKIKNMTDCVIGSAFLGRTKRKDRQIFGVFSNPMPIRYEIGADMSILSFIKATHNRFFRSLKYQKYPYHIFEKDLRFKEHGLSQLYSTCINYYNTSPPCDIDGMLVTNAELFNGHQDYPMQIVLRHWNQGRLQIEYDYWIDLFKCEEIKDLHKRLMLISKQVIQNDQMKIKDIKLVTEEEYEYSVSIYNRTYDKQSSAVWAKQFFDTVRQYKDNIAISQGDRSMSYSKLLIYTDRVAHYLSEMGIKKGEVIPVITQHTIECLIVIFAIVRIGAIYLPIDERLPIKRINIILAHCKARYLFAGSVETSYPINKLDINNALEYKQKSSFNIEYLDDDPVYLIYTSGSSGDPKGVLINNKNLMNYLLWAKKTYTKPGSNIFGLFTSLSFDFSITSLFLPVICGAEIRLFERIEFKNIFKDLLVEKKVNILKITPSHIALMESFTSDKTAVHTCIVGGEQLTTEACRKLQKVLGEQCRIFNEYGPTEATVGCMTYRFNKNDPYNVVPIGEPISNMAIYLLDHDGQPVPPGEIGEIFIGGASVSNGYYLNDVQTKISYSFNERLGDGQLYRSGDLAYRNKEGRLVYYGRNNNVVKVRGRWIHLTEIEQTFHKSGLVLDTIIKIIHHNEDTDQIAAYLIPNINYQRKSLCDYLEEQLPDYMVPDIYIEMGQYPLTENNKVDKKSLPIPILHTSQTYKTPVEYIDILLKAVNRIIPNKAFDQHDNFFAIEGDSIKAIQISSYLMEFGIQLSVKDIMEHPIFNEMSFYMGNNDQAASIQVECSGTIPCLPIVQWLFSCYEKDRNRYSQSMVLKQQTILDDYQWRHAIPTIIHQHDALRINFDISKNCLYYNDIHLYDGAELIKLSMRTEEWESYYYELLNTPFDLTKDLLIRFYQIDFQDNDNSYVLIIAHHLCVDQVSWNIILEDLDRLLQPVYTKGPILPPKTVSYQSYINNLQHQNTQLGFTCDEPPVLAEELEYENCYLDIEMTRQLMGSANVVYNTTPQELLLSAVVMTLNKMWDKVDILYEVEGHGRSMFKDIDVSRTVGWFTSLSPVQFDTNIDWQNLIIEVKEKCRMPSEYKSSETRHKRIRYNFFGVIEHIHYNSFDVHHVINNRSFGIYNPNLYLMEIIAAVNNNRLQLIINKQKALGAGLLSAIIENLENLLEHCKTSPITYTPSDFKLVDLTLDDIKDLSEQ